MDLSQIKEYRAAGRNGKEYMDCCVNVKTNEKVYRTAVWSRNPGSNKSTGKEV